MSPERFVKGESERTIELQRFRFHLKRTDCAVSLSQFYPNGPKTR